MIVIGNNVDVITIQSEVRRKPATDAGGPHNAQVSFIIDALAAPSWLCCKRTYEQQKADWNEMAMPDAGYHRSLFENCSAASNRTRARKPLPKNLRTGRV